MVSKKLPLDREQKLIETLSGCDNVKNSKEHYSYLCQLKSRFESNPKKQDLKKIFEAFGNEDRLLILDVLRENDRSLCELEVVLQKTQPAVSHHIKILEECQLIKGVKHGKFTHYSLVEKRFQEGLKLFQEWYEEIVNWFGNVELNNATRMNPKSAEKI